MKLKIFVDHRESTTRILDILRKKEVNVHKKQLKTADYLLSKRVAVERKTVNDFLQSICDGRLFKQLRNMKKSYTKPLLIIEGHENIFESRNIHPNAISGAMASIAIDSSIPIIWTRHQKETANFLYSIAKREQNEKQKDIRIREKIRSHTIKRHQEFVVTGLPNVSNVLARRLLDRFKTPEKIFRATSKELQEVEGIGKEKAEFIRKVLSNRYRVL